MCVRESETESVDAWEITTSVRANLVNGNSELVGRANATRTKLPSLREASICTRAGAASGIRHPASGRQVSARECTQHTFARIGDTLDGHSTRGLFASDLDSIARLAHGTLDETVLEAVRVIYTIPAREGRG